MSEALQTAMKNLRLSGMSQTLEVRLQEAPATVSATSSSGTGAPG
jgi:hypothetical protein